MEIQSKIDAQVRADRIGAFQAELAVLLQEKVVTLSDDQHSAIAGYHERLLAGLSTSYDIDVDCKGVTALRVNEIKEKKLEGYKMVEKSWRKVVSFGSKSLRQDFANIKAFVG